MNGYALSTQQSTCLACSSDHISSDGNVFISLNNLSLLMNLYEITPPLVKHCVCSEEVIDRSSALRVSDTYGRLKALMLAVLTVSISGFLGWVYWFVWHNCKENQEEIFLISPCSWLQGDSMQRAHLCPPPVPHRHGRHRMLHGLLCARRWARWLQGKHESDV